jgi:hypothetical protein
MLAGATEVFTIAIVLFMTFQSSCSLAGGRIEETAARTAAYAKLAEIAPEKQFDIAKLREPAVEDDRGKWIYDFRDERQDGWIVVIVHPNGFAEVSFTNLSDKGGKQPPE